MCISNVQVLELNLQVEHVMQELEQLEQEQAAKAETATFSEPATGQVGSRWFRSRMLSWWYRSARRRKGTARPTVQLVHFVALRAPGDTGHDQRQNLGQP